MENIDVTESGRFPHYWIAKEYMCNRDEYCPPLYLERSIYLTKNHMSYFSKASHLPSPSRIVLHHQGKMEKDQHSEASCTEVGLTHNSIVKRPISADYILCKLG